MYKSLVELYQKNAQQFSDEVAFLSGPPKFNHQLTWKKIWSLAEGVFLQLQRLGFKEGDHVSIYASSSWRWEVAQLAILMGHGVVVGIDPNETESNLKRISELTELKFIFCEQQFLFEKIKKNILTTYSQITVIDLSEKRQIEFVEQVDFSTERVINQRLSFFSKQDDLAFIIFTSGTTSEPKAIAYSHKKILFAIENIISTYSGQSNRANSVCWLPLANLFQRMMNFCTVATTGTIYFIENPVEVMSYLPIIRPKVFISVPRFYEKVYEKIQLQINSSFFLIRIFLKFGLWLATTQFSLVQKYEALSFTSFFLWPWEILLFKRLRSIFGGNIEMLISGSAAMRKDILVFFHSLKMPILEAYGVSENAVPNAANRLNDFKIGSVGKPIIEGSIKLSTEGEVLVRGEGVFSGYLQKENSSFFEDGYYKTGDLGIIDQDGFLFLAGRKTALFKTATGKKVSITEIENQFKKARFADQIVVLGEGRKLPLILVTVDFEKLAHFVGISVDELIDLETGDIKSVVQAEMDFHLRSLWKNLDLQVKPGGALILNRRFSLEQQEITPNLKIRNHAIEKKFQKSLDQLYLQVDENPQFPILFVNEVENKASFKKPKESSIWRVLQIFKVIYILLKFSISAKISSQFKRSDEKHNIRKLGQILRESLGTLKGPLQKVGQIMSYLAEELPGEIREELKELLRDGSMINSHVIRSVVEAELRKPISAVFSEWQDEPIATGSVGQVHWARLMTGEEVAVKVLIPNIDKILQTDMKILKIFLPIFKWVFKFESIYQHYDELKNLLMSECDFEKEAYHMMMFSEIFKDDSRVIIPKVYSRYNTKKVLVMDYIFGQSLSEFAQTASEIQKQQAAEVIWTISCYTVSQYALFHADPHPGNYIFVNNNKISLIDFGFCKKWTPEFIKNWSRQIISGCENDLNGFSEASKSLGLICKGNENYYKELLQVYQDVVFLPWLKDENFRFTHEFVRHYLNTLLKHQVLVSGLQLPSEFLAISRLYSGIFVIMAELEAEANFHQLTIPYFAHNNQKQ